MIKNTNADEAGRNNASGQEGPGEECGRVSDWGF